MNDLKQQIVCESKKFYDTEFEATLAAARSESSLGKPMEPYQCPFGGHWHVRSVLKEDRGKTKIKYWICEECQVKIKNSNKRKHRLKHERHRGARRVV